MPRPSKDLNQWWEGEEKALEAERLIQDRMRALALYQQDLAKIRQEYKNRLKEAQERHDFANQAWLTQEKASSRTQNASVRPPKNFLNFPLTCTNYE